MITLITGVPGSGKTLYTVDKILRGLVGSTVDLVDDETGAVSKVERVIYSNINGLLIDHVMIDAEWLNDIKQNATVGAVVVFDEVQRVWPNRPSQSKKPPAVEYLETHRHDGIDLVIMTQNPQLLDPAVRSLVGRHLHIRRVANFGAAIVYEWDGCSNGINYKAAFTKSGYRYSADAQKLYKSAKVHTKMARKMPAAVWFVLLAVAGSLYAWPHLMDKITGVSAKAAPQAPSGHVPATALADKLRQQHVAQQPPAAQQQPIALSQPYAQAVGPVLHQPPAEVFSGCVRVRTVCRCYTTQGMPLDRPREICDAATLPPPVTLSTVTPPALPGESVDVTIPARRYSEHGTRDGAVIAWMRDR